MSTRHQWTADELAYLRAHYPTTRTADLVQKTIRWPTT